MPGKRETREAPAHPLTTQTTLTARSVLASALLGMDPPELHVSWLVHLSSLFGVNENRARVALSRMLAAGEVTTDGNGRYRLSGHLLDRAHRQYLSLAGQTRPWRGDWHVVLVTKTGSNPEMRQRRRRALLFSRLAELREGVWLRPDNIDVELPHAIEGDVAYLKAQSEHGRDLAADLWDLDEWANEAHGFLDALDKRPPSDWPDLAPGFELGAAVMRHLQADPLLPPELVPKKWPGPSLRRTWEDWDKRYRKLLVSWIRSGRT